MYKYNMEISDYVECPHMVVEFKIIMKFGQK